MKKTTILLALLGFNLFAMAQNKTAHSTSYKTAAGIKVWNGGGLNLKTFLKEEKEALEFIGFFGSGFARITGLYEFHGDLSTDGELKWYVGPGAHVNFYKSYTYTNNGVVTSGTALGIGIDGVVGLDYKFKELPLNLAVDWQPSFEFVKGGSGFSGNWGGFAVRYTF